MMQVVNFSWRRGRVPTFALPAVGFVVVLAGDWAVELPTRGATSVVMSP